MSHFGATLRLLRLDAGLSLRALAERVGVSSAYLSRVENGHDRVPTPDRLDAIAQALGIAPSVLVQLGDQVGPFVTRYLQRVPAANLLFLEMARRDLDTAQLAVVRAFIARRFPGGESPAAAPGLRLGSLLSTNRIVVHLSCDDLDDAIDMAAARLARHAGAGGVASARAIAERIAHREHEVSTAIGNGFGVPHAIVPGAPLEAALVTLAKPLGIRTPDGLPLRILVVVIGAEGGGRFLEVLAQVARLASMNAGATLCAAREPRQLLSRLAELEDAAA